MPVFVVSLFLPYTVDFHDLPSPDQRASPIRAPSRGDYFGDAAASRSSLFPELNGSAKPARTPGITAEQERLFNQSQPSASIHFMTPHDPRTLMRSDAHVPDWGSGHIFNHPPSRALDLPPRTLLGHYRMQPGQDEHGVNNGVGIGAPQRKRRQTPSKARRPNGSRHARSTSTHERPSWGSEWTVEPAEQGNGGLANAVKAAQREGTIGEDIIWVGTVGFPTDAIEDQVKNDIAEKFEADFDALAVYVEDSDFDGHYTHFCKTILWPVFHYQIPDHPKSKAYEDHSYRFYVKVNQLFADKIIASYKRGDIVWIHDYHLLLVPAMVRAKLPDAKIGFFLHAAFPSSEVFRCLYVRKQLLEGMLGANLIAFQSAEYQEHFLTTCSRLLIVEATEHGVQLEGRFVNVISVPIGVDPAAFSSAKESSEVAEWIETMLNRYKGKKLIVARDKLDHVKGVRQKLLAFELFLHKYPEYKDEVVLIQVATSTPDNQQLTEVVAEIVNRIDAEYSTLAHQPLVFLRQDIPFSQYFALLAAADVLMITSLREGMNLTCHEYILCQDGSLSAKKHGPLILSEFTGSSSLFGGHDLSVNPWDYQKCADAIKAALDMSEEEKSRRYKHLREVVLNQTGYQWAQQNIDALNKYHSEHQQRDTAAIPRLNFTTLSEKYARSHKRLFFLDYDGTLANFQSPNNVHFGNPQRMIEALGKLVLDDRNIVYIMSGRTIQSISRIFALMAGIGLIAENGCFVRPEDSYSWSSIVDRESINEWKGHVKQILQYYVERIEGSRVEEKECSLTFNYEKVPQSDLESATRQAGDCANHINDVINKNRIHAVPIEKSVHVEPLDYNKATGAQYVFKTLKEKGVQVDFLFVAGDDREDEEVYKWANKLKENGDVGEVTTVSLGKRNTEAGATLTQGTSGLLSVLQKLARMR